MPDLSHSSIDSPHLDEVVAREANQVAAMHRELDAALSQPAGIASLAESYGAVQLLENALGSLRDALRRESENRL